MEAKARRRDRTGGGTEPSWVKTRARVARGEMRDEIMKIQELSWQDRNYDQALGAIIDLHNHYQWGLRIQLIAEARRAKLLANRSMFPMSENKAGPEVNQREPGPEAACHSSESIAASQCTGMDTSRCTPYDSLGTGFSIIRAKDLSFAHYVNGLCFLVREGGTIDRLTLLLQFYSSVEGLTLPQLRALLSAHVTCTMLGAKVKPDLDPEQLKRQQQQGLYQRAKSRYKAYLSMEDDQVCGLPWDKGLDLLVELAADPFVELKIDLVKNTPLAALRARLPTQ